ncbi:MAG: DUF465 domain-containing protein [Pseudomonadota bacterium]
MNLSSHLDQLRSKHEALKTKIKEEERRPGVDHLEIAAMKRKKLQVKEEISRLSQQVH